ncbi:MAG TPA: peptide ABC transporter substrate-binding protein [Anaerolineaceae bacterium]|nr:peptide ABC transporter substrate-binding protein [Anaerolineaceae bacterium]
MSKRVLSVVTLLVAASILFAACQPTPAATPEIIIQTVMVEGTPQVIEVTATPGPTEPPAAGPKVLRLNTGSAGDIPTIDPALSEDTTSIQIVDETTIGLSRQNEVTTETEPGLASSWDISEDGLVYTFHLRNDVPWVKYDAVADEVVQVLDCEGNPRMVTAEDFVYGIQRSLTPATGSPYAFMLGFVVEGAQGFIDGATEDFSTVGIQALDSETLEVTFIAPAAFNATIMGAWVAHAQPSWLIEGDDCTEARGDRWTETGFFQGYGPFVLKEWIHDTELTLVKNPFWPGSESVPQAKIDEITWTMIDLAPAFAEYEAGNLDVAEVPLADMDRAKSDPMLSAELTTGPELCTYYLGFNVQANLVDDVRLRRALSLAVDRQSLIDNVTKGGEIPAQWFSRPGLAAAPTLEEYPDLGVKYDPEQAKALLEEYLADTDQTVEDLESQITLMYNTRTDHQRIAETVQQMWKDTLGFTVQLANQEWRVFLVTTKDPVNTPQIFRLGWCQDYPDANNWLKDQAAVGGNNNPSGPGGGGFNWRNDEYEQLVAEAAVLPDLAERTELYAQAEEILVWDDAVLIPLYWYTNTLVSKPHVERTFSVLGNLERLEKWDILQ